MESQVVVITGCSSGIGHDLAKTLALSGYTVIATARNAETLNDLQVALKLSLDVTRQASVDDAIRTVIDRFGKIDVLINNAGHSVRATVEDTDEALARDMFDVNVWGLLRVTQAVLPYMRENQKGRIILIGSVMGKFVFPLNGSYAASKHAVEALADAMRVELMPFGIKVVMIEPGTIQSSFFASSKLKSQTISDNPNSPYKNIYERFYKMSESSSFQGASPSQVSKIVQRAMETKNPKPRYLAAVSIPYRLMLVLGDRNRDQLLAKVFGMKRLAHS